MTGAARILVVEDEVALRDGLRIALSAAGYQVLDVADGEAALERAAGFRPDLLVLDVMLPGADGFQVCRRLREDGLDAPVIFLTARAGELDQLAGFAAGGDDYVTKPFQVAVLLARVEARLRGRATIAEVVLPQLVRLGPLELDLAGLAARRGPERIGLTPREAAVLAVLVDHRGRPVPRHELLDRVWGEDAYPTTRTVDMQVRRLREKLEADPAQPRFILTVHGVGYRLADDDEL